MNTTPENNQLLTVIVESYKRRSRFEIALILLACGVLGWGFSYVLLQLGFGSMDLRYGLCALAVYPVFLAFLMRWLHVSMQRIADNFSRIHADELRTTTSPPVETRARKSGAGDVIGDIVNGVTGNGILESPWAILAVVLFTILAGSVVALVLSPFVILDLVVAESLGLLLFRKIDKLRMNTSGINIIGYTLLPFAGVMFTLVIAGTVIGYFYPDAHSFGDFIKTIVSG